MIHLEYSSGHGRRFVTFPAHCLQLLAPLDYFLLAILNEPRSLISVLLHSLVLDSLMIAAHDLAEIFHIVRLSRGIRLSSDASIRHRHVTFKSCSISLLFTLYFTLIKGSVPS